MEIGDRIRKARRDRGLTQVKLAQLVGVDKSAVAQWESTASRNGITIENLKKAAHALGVLPSELLGQPVEDEGIRVADTRQIALLNLFTKMPAHQQDVMLELFYTTVSLSKSDEPKRRPAKGQRIAS